MWQDTNVRLHNHVIDTKYKIEQKKSNNFSKVTSAFPLCTGSYLFILYPLNCRHVAFANIESLKFMLVNDINHIHHTCKH